MQNSRAVLDLGSHWSVVHVPRLDDRQMEGFESSRDRNIDSAYQQKYMTNGTHGTNLDTPCRCYVLHYTLQRTSTYMYM